MRFRIRDPQYFNPGSGMEKFGSSVNIPDLQCCLLHDSQERGHFQVENKEIKLRVLMYLSYVSKGMVQTIFKNLNQK